MTKATWRLIGAAAIGLSTAHALAGDEPPAPAAPPASAKPPATPTSTPPAAPAAPTTPAPVHKPAPHAEPPPPAPAMPKVRVATRRGQILPEGTFLVSRQGQLVADDSVGRWGGWTFRFDPDAKGTSEAPMVLMPCVRLEAMQRLASTRSAGVVYNVSGQVFVYQGQNYLLPVYDEARAAASEAPAAPKAAEPEPVASTPPPAPGSPEEEVQRRIKVLDNATRDRPLPIPPPAPAATPGGDAPTPDAKPVGELRTPPKRGGLVAEGTYLASRRGRLVRETGGGGGEWVMRFDADARGQVDPPMMVLPCLNLEAMERVAAFRGDSVNFIVSGQVYVFEERNYLLPTLYRIEGTNQDLLPGR